MSSSATVRKPLPSVDIARHAPTASVIAELPSRYETRASSRLFGVAGTSAVILMLAGATLLTWRSYASAPEPARLSVFDVAAPAAVPESMRDFPPEPEELQPEKPQPAIEEARIAPPEIMVPSIMSARPIVMPLPAETASVEKKAAPPETPPAPPAPKPSAGKPTWQGLVLGALNKVRRYPREARFARQQGVPYIRFVMNRDGKVLSSRIERSSGFSALDEEAVSLPKRAQPLPKPPEDVKGDTIELVVPVEFFMR